jgi:hypothetical protein
LDPEFPTKLNFTGGLEGTLSILDMAEISFLEDFSTCGFVGSAFKGTAAFELLDASLPFNSHDFTPLEVKAESADTGLWLVREKKRI